MISSQEIKIERPAEFTSQYIENQLNNLGLDVLRWTITDVDEKFYTISIAVVND